MHDSNIEDIELMKRIINDDLTAFQLLFDKYWEPLFIYASSKLRSSVEAECIIEGLFGKIWEQRALYSLNERVDMVLFNELKKLIIRHYSDTFYQ